jgi:hypothetical protein
MRASLVDLYIRLQYPPGIPTAVVEVLLRGWVVVETAWDVSAFLFKALVVNPLSYYRQEITGRRAR